MQPQLGHTGLPSVSGQRSRRNTFSTPRSHIRMIFAALSVRAAAESKKCCATAIVPTKMSKYSPDTKAPQVQGQFFRWRLLHDAGRLLVGGGHHGAKVRARL